MRFFLDTEYDGWGGALLSLALVPEDGGEEFYIVLDCQSPVTPWVERNVVPFLWLVPDALKGSAMGREDAAAALAAFLQVERDPLIVADWPEDIALFNMLLVTGPARMAAVPPLRFALELLPGFSTAANSRVPHNALHDARALRDHVLAMEGI